MLRVVSYPKESKELSYPCLVKNVKNGTIILFGESHKGTIVQSSNKNHIGRVIHCGALDSEYELYSGKVIIENE